MICQYFKMITKITQITYTHVPLVWESQNGFNCHGQCLVWPLQTTFALYMYLAELLFFAIYLSLLVNSTLISSVKFSPMLFYSNLFCELANLFNYSYTVAYSSINDKPFHQRIIIQCRRTTPAMQAVLQFVLAQDVP